MCRLTVLHLFKLVDIVLIHLTFSLVGWTQCSIVATEMETALYLLWLRGKKISRLTMDGFEEQLGDEVRKYSHLYDPTQRDFKDVGLMGEISLRKHSSGHGQCPTLCCCCCF